MRIPPSTSTLTQNARRERTMTRHTERARCKDLARNAAKEISQFNTCRHIAPFARLLIHQFLLFSFLPSLLYCFSIWSRIARVNSCVVALPPMSLVLLLPSAITS